MSSRRSHGEGSIYQRSDGRWVATLRDGQKRVTRYARSQQDARKALQKMHREREHGVLGDNSQKLRDFLRRWYSHQEQRLRPRTLESYDDIIRLHLEPTLGHIPLGKLTPQHVQDVLDDRLKRGLSARRVLHIRAVLRTALNQAMRWEIVHRNVALAVEPPRVGVEKRPRALTEAEARALLKAAQEKPGGSIWLVILALGLRRGEAAGLQWKDVDLTGGEISIRRSLQRIRGHWEEQPTKTGRERVIALPDFALRALEQRQAEQQLEAAQAGADWQGERWGHLVWASPDGTPLDSRRLWDSLQVIAAEAGIGALRVHDLRHSAASLMLAAGVPVVEVAAVLGHSQPSTTANIYAHVLASRQRRAADTIHALLAGGQGEEAP
ncbi:MAG: tyrosine-type recombinase/integrase [Pseudomonadota bacterium]